MKIIGITGLIASGKTEAARIFANFGADILDADREARKVLLKSGAAYKGVVAEFGGQILGADGEIDRKKLGGIVFADRNKLEILNSLTHKYILENMRCSISTRTSTTNRDGSVVIDALFLYESRLHELCGYWLFVDADEEIRRLRLLKRDKLSNEAANSRIESQKHLGNPEKLAKADCILTNNGSFDGFIKKTEELARNVLENC